MLNHVKTKFLIVFLFCILVVTLIVKVRGGVSGATFTSYFPSDSTLAFQHENRFVTLNVLSGTLNSSVCTLAFGSQGGTYTFEANETVTLQIDFNVSKVQVAGDQNINNRQIQSGDTITINSGNNVLISWYILIEPWLPIKFIIGMVGLACMFGGPLYGIALLKKDKYYSGMRVLVLFTITGFTLVLAWLW